MKALGRRQLLRTGGRALVGLTLCQGLGCVRSLRAGAPSSATSGTRKALAARLDREIRGLMDALTVPAVSVAVFNGNELPFVRAFGVKDVGSKKAVDPETVFEAQSMSKPVFAYAVMQLTERKVIDLDVPLTRYTSKRLIEADPRLDLITARHVLSHSAGFQNWRSQQRPLAIQFIPGERHLYSGEAYNYLQSVVTELRGHRDPTRCSTFEADAEFCATDFDSYMSENVLTPFGMGASGYVWGGRFKNYALPHDVEGRPLQKAHPTAVDIARYGAAGGLHTTASDYAMFMMHVVGSASRGRFDLMPERLREMVRPQIKQNDSSSWALGWAVQHTPDGDFLYHAGDSQGFHSMAVASVAKQSGYALLTNGANGTKLIEQLLSGETLVQFL